LKPKPQQVIQIIKRLRLQPSFHLTV